MRNSEGFALLLTLWVLAALSVLLLTFGMLTSSNVKASSYFKKDCAAYYLARGGLKRVALKLIPDRTLGKDADLSAIRGELLGTWIVRPTDWSVTKADSSDLNEFVICEVSPEDAKLPLNRATKEMLSKLPDVSPVLAENIVALVKTKKEAGGFKYVEELLSVDGVSGGVYDGEENKPGLKNLLTTYTDGKIYINNVRKEAILSVPGVDEQLANEITNNLKAGKYFERVEDLQHVIGVTPAIYKSLKEWVKVTPAYYRIKSRANVEGIYREVEGVVKISRENVEIVFLQGG